VRFEIVKSLLRIVGKAASAIKRVCGCGRDAALQELPERLPSLGTLLVEKKAEIEQRLNVSFRQLRVSGYVHVAGGLTSDKPRPGEEADIWRILLADCIRKRVVARDGQATGRLPSDDDDVQMEEQFSFAVESFGEHHRTQPTVVVEQALALQLAQFVNARRVLGGAWYRAGVWDASTGEPQTVCGRPMAFWETLRADCPTLAAVAEERLAAPNGSCDAHAGRHHTVMFTLSQRRCC
jgi:hypothetical protein